LNTPQVTANNKQKATDNIQSAGHAPSTPTLHKYVEKSRVMESLLPGGKPRPGPLGLDSLLSVVGCPWLKVKKINQILCVLPLSELYALPYGPWAVVNINLYN